MNDQHIREQACDITHSFIVQAPAGSGKTTLLLQRFLNALVHSKDPKNVLGMTFTKQSAQEMRKRLEAAFHNPKPTDPLFNWVKKVNTHAKKNDWQHFTQQFNILNIDSFAKQIISQAPLYNRGISQYQIASTSQMHYMIENAIQNAMKHPNTQKAWAVVFELFHYNDLAIKTQYIHMLMCREQWVECILQLPKQSETFQKHIHQWFETRHQILQKQIAYAKLHADQWVIIQQLAAQHPNTAHYQQLCSKTIKNNHLTYHQLARLLLLSKGEKIRARWGTNQGFNENSPLNQVEQKKLKSQLAQITQQLNDHPQAIDALKEYFHFPSTLNPLNLKEHQQLQALQETLLGTYAELELLMHENQLCDFTKITQSACQTLQNQQAIHLENNINHLLIDEFQDTSLSHWSLIRSLTENWQAQQQKSIFLVGDPMQSVYRFRQAEPQLFIQGTLGTLLTYWPIKYLVLRTNFRSDKQLVEHNNHLFKAIMPKQKDPLTTAINFEPSVGEKTYPNSVFQCHCFDQKNLHTTLSNLLENLPQSEHQHLTILARTNQLLGQVSTYLHQLNIKHQINSAGQNAQHLNDINTLFCALTNLHNPLAWFSLLRTPFIGLILADINCIHQSMGQHIYQKWQYAYNSQTLSADGLARSAIVLPQINTLLNHYPQKTRSDWIAECIKRLTLKQLPKTIINTLITYINRHPTQQMIDFSSIKDALLNQQKNPQQALPNSLNLMTIHAAKGLEFDHLIVIDSYGQTPTDPPSPFLWLVDPNTQTLLLSAYSRDNTHPIYPYIQYIQKCRKTLEQHRLFYVACTRAKKTLHLIEKENTLKKYNLNIKETSASHASQTTQHIQYQRIKQQYLQNYPTPPLTTYPIANPYNPTRQPKQKIGEIIHHILDQWSTAHQVQPLDDQTINYLFKRYQIRLDDQKWAKQYLQQNIEKMIHDPTLGWIVSKHCDDHHEWPLIYQHQSLRIDRCFFDQNRWWIIDYKVQFDDSLDEKTAQNQHAQQLQHYGEALFTIKKQPIILGIYLTYHQKLLKWPFKKQNTS